MNGQGGLLKHLIWIVPVTIFVLWYVSQQQRVQEDDMKAEFAKFDEDFARMSEGLSSGNEKKEWAGAKAEAHDRYVSAKERAVDSSKKADDTFAEMEKELNSVDTSNMGENK
jgi:hypothetical protein